MADGGSVGPQSSFGRFVNNVNAPGQMSVDNGAGSMMPQDNSDLAKGASAFGKGLFAPSTPSAPAGQMAGGAMDTTGMPSAPDATGLGLEGPVMAAAKGGKVPAMVSPGEVYLSPEKAKAAKQGKINPLQAGEKIPGKPKVGGAKNDYANDTVPKTLEEGGLVLPRSVTQSKNPEWAAHAFVRAHMANGGMVPGLYSKKSKKSKK
jgi:hypothetical protein